MVDKSPLDTIRETLEIMGITKVVCVDDQSMDEPNFEHAMAVVEGTLLDQSRAQDVINALCIRNLPTGAKRVGRRRSLLQDQWCKLDEQQRWELFRRILELQPTANSLTDSVHGLPISKHFPEGVSVQTYTPEQWNVSATDVIAQAGEKNGLLCLFDLSLNPDGPGDERGIELLSAAFAEHSDYVVVGILTNTVRPEDELQRQRSLAETHNVDVLRIVVLSKERLIKASAFSDGIVRLVRNGSRDRLTGMMNELFDASSSRARKRLEDLSLDAFAQIVVHQVENEGEYDANGLFRLQRVAQQAAFEQAIAADHGFQTIVCNLEMMRKLTSRACIGENHEEECLHLAHDQFYVPGEFINPLHLRPSLGDVYQIADQRYVLVGQPCDIALRRNHGRKLRSANLCRIETQAPTETQRPLMYELRCFHDPQWVSLRDGVHSVSFDILDLASFNASGECKMILSQECALIDTNLSGRFKLLREKYAEEYDRVLRVRDAWQCQGLEQVYSLSELIGPRLSRSSLDISLGIQDGGLSFGIRRVERLREEYAHSLLASFAVVMARPAEDVPLNT